MRTAPLRRRGGSAAALSPLLLVLASGCALFRPSAPEYEPYTTERGIRVRDLVVPDGPIVYRGDTVTLHYEVFLEDGTRVDSSIDRGLPVTFVVGEGEVPPGLEDGILGMRELGRRRIEVPPHLAFGEEGSPPDIPANAAVTFDVEVLEVER